MSKVVYIDAPEALTRKERTIGAAITGIMWVVYAYLWMPLVSLLAWGLGFELAYDALVEAGGIATLRSALWWYDIVLAIVILTVVVWSQLNRWRFAGKNRRTAHQTVPDEELADYFGVSCGDLERLRASRGIELDIDVAGRPVLHDTSWPAHSPPTRQTTAR